MTQSRKTGPCETALIVDDTPDNILILREILSPEVRTLAATNGREALALARAVPPPDIILLDILMPGMDGYEVCRRLKADPQTSSIPVLFVSTLGTEIDEAKGLSLGAADYIGKPLSPAVVRARVQSHLRLKAHQHRLEELVQERTRALLNTQDATIHCLACLAEMRDNELGGHFRRTQCAMELVASTMAKMPACADFFRKTTVEMLVKSTPLHDVGKIGVPDHILLKPGRLSAEEFEVMKLHTAYGRESLRRAEEILDHASFLGVACEIAYSHHEKWDGGGYPEGLAGEDIPLPGRIMAVIDVYDAIISKRVYKTPIPHSKAVAIIAEERGRHFDPVVADVFLALAEEIRTISRCHADFEEEREALER
ncbi:metal dependent phosphohydrolase [Desulfovibrio sp. X2]|uniref:response regulator n=1 Tax=Desulfovibrio sp. X2 TaxID=941449 RepID=UPI0003588240|nr:HD domain-containing phosphohydrolase [Desulfovibrio sp. X2]EPR41174.1 metal dependent phosphohydrolase [Desulfovibrio sp. X2]